jgi:hypothetical protein
LQCNSKQIFLIIERGVNVRGVRLSFHGNMCVAAMEHPLVHLVKRCGSVFHQYDFRPLVLRVVWCANILLVSFVFWVFVYYCLRNFN